jgi:hypothetical protein
MTRFSITFAIASALAALLTAQTKAPKTYKRAQPPKFAKTDPFFTDAFKEALVGSRPADLGAPATVVRSPAPSPPTPDPRLPTPSPSGAGWSRVISAATIEDAIKSLKLQTDKQITTASDFAGKGHKLARRDYTLLATLFAIAAEYDADVRWKKDAPAARDAFARSAANFKVGTPQAFAEAKARKDELGELVSGSSPFAGKEADAKTDWSKVAGRGPLMQYLETAWEPRLKAALADKSKFTASGEQITRDAEMFAAIGEVLTKEGMEDADDAEYKAFAAKLRDGAQQILDAVKQKNYDQAATGSTAISRACTECHENYRS